MLFLFCRGIYIFSVKTADVMMTIMIIILWSCSCSNFF